MYKNFIIKDKRLIDNKKEIYDADEVGREVTRCIKGILNKGDADEIVMWVRSEKYSPFKKKMIERREKK